MSIWRPRFQVNWNSLKKVQHFFLRMAADKVGIRMSWFDHDYSAVTEILNICDLKVTCNYADLLFLYKLVNHYLDAPLLLEQLSFRVPRKLLRFNNNLFHLPIHSASNLSVVTRLASIGNLFSEVDMFRLNISLFKREIKRMLAC